MATLVCVVSGAHCRPPALARLRRMPSILLPPCDAPALGLSLTCEAANQRLDVTKTERNLLQPRRLPSQRPVETAAGRAHPHRRAHLHRRTNARGPPLPRTVVFGISGSGCPARRHQPPRSNRDGGLVVQVDCATMLSIIAWHDVECIVNA